MERQRFTEGLSQSSLPYARSLHTTDEDVLLYTPLPLNEEGLRDQSCCLIYWKFLVVDGGSVGLERKMKQYDSWGWSPIDERHRGNEKSNRIGV